MNEENILIIGDDLEQDTNQPARAAGGNSPADDGSWLAGRKNVFAENFLEKHRSEFEDYQRMEREKISCAERFRALDAEITARRQWLESLQAEIATYQTVDIAADIFKNMQLTGQPLLEIAENPLFSAAVLIKEHGKRILHLAEKDVAELQTKFDAFKSEKREVLKELKLT